MYADRKINQLLAERRAVFNQVSELTNRIKLQARQALTRPCRSSACGRRVGTTRPDLVHNLWTTWGRVGAPATGRPHPTAHVVARSSTAPVHVDHAA